MKNYLLVSLILFAAQAVLAQNKSPCGSLLTQKHDVDPGLKVTEGGFVISPRQQEAISIITEAARDGKTLFGLIGVAEGMWSRPVSFIGKILETKYVDHPSSPAFKFLVESPEETLWYSLSVGKFGSYITQGSLYELKEIDSFTLGRSNHDQIKPYIEEKTYNEFGKYIVYVNRHVGYDRTVQITGEVYYSGFTTRTWWDRVFHRDEEAYLPFNNPEERASGSIVFEGPEDMTVGLKIFEVLNRY